MNSWLKNFAFGKKKGYFFAPNVRGKGVFSKMENADMSSFIVLSEGAGGPSTLYNFYAFLYYGRKEVFFLNNVVLDCSTPI